MLPLMAQPLSSWSFLVEGEAGEEGEGEGEEGEGEGEGEEGDGEREGGSTGFGARASSPPPPGLGARCAATFCRVLILWSRRQSSGICAFCIVFVFGEREEG